MTLSSFPVMDKQLMMEHFDELVTVPDLKQMELRQFDEHKSTEQKTFKYKYHMVHSSGSTGTPGYFVYYEEAWSQMLSGIIRAALWDIVRLHDGGTDEIPDSQLSVFKKASKLIHCCGMPPAPCLKNGPPPWKRPGISSIQYPDVPPSLVSEGGNTNCCPSMC